MLNHNFFFLTNVNSVYSALLKFSNQSTNKFDFLIHSTEIENKHYSDLRNSKTISALIYDDSIVIFYLTGNLGIYVVDDFFRNYSNLGHKVIYVFPAPDLFYSENNSQLLATRQTIKIIETKSEEYLFISALMTEDNYAANFKKLDEKYFPHSNKIKDLVITNENLLDEILNISTADNSGTTIHCVNTKYDLVKNAIERIKFNPIEKLLDRTIIQEYNALAQYFFQLSKMKNISLINSGKRQKNTKIKGTTNNHYSERADNSNEHFLYNKK